MSQFLHADEAKTSNTSGFLQKTAELKVMIITVFPLFSQCFLPYERQNVFCKI